MEIRETTSRSPPGLRPNSKAQTHSQEESASTSLPEAHDKSFSGNLCLREAPLTGCVSHLNLGL